MNIIKPASEIQRMPLALDRHTVATLRNPAAIAQRDDLLARAQNIERVIGDKSQEQALAMLGEIGASIKAAEASKKEVKEPFNAVCKTIEEVLREHSAPLAVEKLRLKALLENYQLEVEAKAKEEARKLELERQRLENEQRAKAAEEQKRQEELFAKAKAAEAEAERIRVAAEQEKANAAAAEQKRQRELAAEAQAATSEAARQLIALEQRRSAEAAAEQQRQRDIAAQAQAAANEATALALAAEQQRSAEVAAMKQAELEIAKANTLQVEAPKVAGMTVRKPWRVEVLDVAALYKARPDMVTLTPKQAELNKLVAGETGLRELAGCKVFQDMEVTSR